MAGDRDQTCLTGGDFLMESALPALSTKQAFLIKERLGLTLLSQPVGQLLRDVAVGARMQPEDPRLFEASCRSE
jgi:hypothetical protein